MNVSLLRIAALSLLCVFAGEKIASASTLTLTYYNISANEPDANHLGGGVYSNEVASTLGLIAGLPVLNISPYTNCAATSSCYFPLGPGTKTPTSLLSDGEITYWSPANNPYVSLGTSIPVTLPFVDDNFFGPNGTGICSGPAPCGGYQAATLTGTITAPTTETLQFTISSDDMAFAYIDGNLVCSDGGIHVLLPVPCTTSTISAGDHNFALFFVDLQQVASGLEFSIQSVGVTTTQTSLAPEPGTLVLLGTGLIGSVGAIRRRLNQ